MEQGVRHIRRVRADEANATDSRDFVDFDEQIGEARRLFPLDVTITIDRLPKKRYFDATLVGEGSNFVQNILRRARLLRPANARDDAVRAELIAPEHNAHHRLEDARSNARQAFRVVLAERVANDARRVAVLETVDADRDLLRPGRGGVGDQIDETIDLPRADDDVDVRRSAENRRLVFLRHTPHHADQRAGLLRFPMLQSSERAVNFLLGVFANAAGVEEQKRGVLARLGSLPTGGNQLRRREFRVERVHLTTDRFNVKLFHRRRFAFLFESLSLPPFGRVFRRRRAFESRKTPRPLPFILPEFAATQSAAQRKARQKPGVRANFDEISQEKSSIRILQSGSARKNSRP